MKKLNIILLIVTAIFLYSCSGKSNISNSGNTDTSTTLIGKSNDNANDIPYMVFKSDEKIGNKICIKVTFPKGEKVWIDWNKNKKFDEDEKINSEPIYNDFIEKKIILKDSNFNIYGAVTVLECAGSNITEIDISHNPNLEKLFCQSNELTSLNISKNKSLRTLCCQGNYMLKELDISNNTQLEYLEVPAGMKSKVFNFRYGFKEIEKQLKKQNLIPEGYHIFGIAENSNPADSEYKNDQLIQFEEDIPYADRQGSNVNTKIIYFRSMDNKQYKILGQADNLDIYFGINNIYFENEFPVIKYEKEIDMGEHEKWFYTIEDGKIVDFLG